MENSNVNRLSFGASLTAKLSSLIMLVLQLYCGLIFYNGIVSYFRWAELDFADSFGIVERVKLLFKWITKVFVGEVPVFPGLLILLHFVVFVIAAINIVISLVRFFGLFFGKEDKCLRNHKNSYTINKKFVGSSVWMLFFLMLSSWWMPGYRLLNNAKLLIVVIAAGILISRLARCILTKVPFTTFVCQILYCALMFAIIGLIMVFCSCDVISIVDYSIDIVASMKGSPLKEKLPIILSACACVVLAAMMLNALAMVHSCKYYATVPNKSIKRSGIIILVFAVIFVILGILATKNFEWESIKTYITFLLVALSAFLFGLIEPKLEKAPKNDDADGEDEEVPEAADEAPSDEPAPEAAPQEAEPAEPAPAPVPKIVFVGKRVKKIKSKKYRNRRDINVIVIPESVVYIEGYSFFGCTELTEIHCERKSKPRFWHSQWNFGCPAKVVWDSANNGEE